MTNGLKTFCKKKCTTNSARSELIIYKFPYNIYHFVRINDVLGILAVNLAVSHFTSRFKEIKTQHRYYVDV